MGAACRSPIECERWTSPSDGEWHKFLLRNCRTITSNLTVERPPWVTMPLYDAPACMHLGLKESRSSVNSGIDSRVSGLGVQRTEKPS